MKSKAAMIRLADIFVFLILPYAPSHVLSPSCHTPQQLVPDGSGGQAAGITQLWKAFSIYGWMDGWSCVYFTIFSVLFLKLDYRQHKRARQPLAYRCLLLLLYGEIQKKYGKHQFWLVTPQIKFLLCSKAFIFFPSHNTTKQNEVSSFSGLRDPTWFHSYLLFSGPMTTAKMCISKLEDAFRDCRKPFCPPMHQA